MPPGGATTARAAAASARTARAWPSTPTTGCAKVPVTVTGERNENTEKSFGLTATRKSSASVFRSMRPTMIKLLSEVSATARWRARRRLMQFQRDNRAAPSFSARSPRTMTPNACATSSPAKLPPPGATTCRRAAGPRLGR